MNRLAITGWSVLSSAGIGPESLRSALERVAEGQHAGHLVEGLYSEPMPSPRAHVLVGFDVRERLGRKGTSSLDRRSALAMVACGQALEDSGLAIDDSNRQRVGIVLGTTMGGLKSMNDYTRDTLVEERPYLVNPIHFPNTVMNCAAGQAAIRFGLKGVNSTVAGGTLAFLNVLRYSANVLRCGYADTLLAGGVEEFTPHMAWATHLSEPEGTALPAGEGAAVFVLRRGEGGEACDAEVLAVASGFNPGGSSGHAFKTALEACVRRALKNAGVHPRDLLLVASCETGDEVKDRIEKSAIAAALDPVAVPCIAVKKILGECHAASGALQTAAVLALHRDRPEIDGRASLITGWSRDGGIAAAVLRGWCRASAHRR
jgi:3-oxoacyl-[acyl-carrier-protein] synthase II